MATRGGARRVRRAGAATGTHQSRDRSAAALEGLHQRLREEVARLFDARLGDWVKGKLRGIQVVKTGDSPRVVRAKVVGSGGATTVTGYDIQSRLAQTITVYRA